MKQHTPGAVLVFLALATSGFGQMLNNDTLNGAWYVRHVEFTTDANNNVTDARSIVGTMTFNGGGYSIVGQQVIGNGAPTPFNTTNIDASYTVTSAGIVTIANPQTNNHQINARYGSEAIIGSSTDMVGNMFDLFVAIPARAANAAPLYSDQTLTVNYHMADFELTNASTAQVRTSGMAAQFDGAGNIQSFKPLGHVASFASGATQTSEEFTGTYSLANDGTGAMTFSPVAGTTTAANLLLAGATRNLYVSATGNVFFAATPGAHDILIGVQNAAVDNISFSGRYWYAGLEANADGTSADLVASASVVPSANTMLLTARKNQAPAVLPGLPNTVTATETVTYAAETGGFGSGNVVTTGDTFILSGNNGTVVSVTTGQDGNGNPLHPTDFQIFFGEQIPTLTGTGVFVNPQGIVNASTYAPVGDNISAGEIIQIYGSNLAPSRSTATKLPFPTNLGGVTVSIDGTLAPLYDVQPGVITCIVPYELTNSQYAAIFVNNNSAVSNTVSVSKFSFTPGVIAANDAGFGDGAITHGQGPLVNTLVNSASPALPGEAVQMYVTGLGALTTPVADGNGFTGVDNALAQPVVLINGTQATVIYAGLTPDAGLYLIDYYVPSGTPNGEQPVTVAMSIGSGSMGIAALTSTITIAVQTPLVNPTLTITTSGAGSGTVATSPVGTSCGAGCQSFAPEQVVTLTPTPATGSTFAGWSGACSGTGGCSVTMTSNLTVNAVFNVAVNPILTITTLGSGAGTVSSSPPGTSCGPGCLSFAPGTGITLTATPAAGSTFSGWSATCLGAGMGAGTGSCFLTMNSAQTVTPVFNLTGFVSGTAASGSPIAGANVTLKDSTGNSSSATTASNGSYALSTAGMTPPFLVQVQTANGNLYSVSADTLTTTTINTHPFTDLIIRSWYNVQGKNIDSAFANPASMPAPSPANVELVLNAITTLAQLWLINADVNTFQYNLISDPFLANGAGIDQVLAESTVNASTINASTGAVTISAGGITQTSTVTWNAGASTITVASTTTNGNSSSGSSVTTVIPAQTAQQTALDGILSTLTGFFNAVTTNGSQLTAGELTPFMAADLVSDGLNQSQLAASLATFWRGGVGGAVQFETVKSLDLVNGIADVVINLDGSEFWFENVAGTWLIGGDNRIAAINLSEETDTYEGAQSGSGPQVNVQVLAPQGTVTGVTVTGAPAITGFNSTKAPQGASSIHNYQPTPTTQLTVELNSFDLLTGFLGNNLVPPGTPFTFVITPASGPAVTYTVPVNVYTTDLVTITSPTSGELSSYTLGEPLAVQWKLPTTFPVVITGVGAVTYTGPENSPSSLTCQVDGVSYSLAVSGPSPYTTLVNATSGTVTIPTTCQGMPVVHFGVIVLARGINDELAYSSLAIQ